MKTYRICFCPIFLAFTQTDIHNITGHYIFNKDHFTFLAGQRLAFGSIGFYRYLLQNNAFLLFSHRAKVSQMTRIGKDFGDGYC